jgi:hypothetical protein
MSESTHYFIFELGNRNDLKHVAQMSGIDALAKPVEDHDFLYYNRKTRKVQWMVLDDSGRTSTSKTESG